MIFLGKVRVAGYSELIDEALKNLSEDQAYLNIPDVINLSAPYQDTDTKLIINLLSEDQYYGALMRDEINDNELYVIKEDKPSVASIEIIDLS